MSTVGERLKEAREWLGLTIEMVASVLSVSEGIVHGWERDIVCPPDGAIVRLARLYGRRVAWLRFGEPYVLDEKLQEFVERIPNEHDRQEVILFAEFLENVGQPKPTKVHIEPDRKPGT